MTGPGSTTGRVETVALCDPPTVALCDPRPVALCDPPNHSVLTTHLRTDFVALGEYVTCDVVAPCG